MFSLSLLAALVTGASFAEQVAGVDHVRLQHLEANGDRVSNGAACFYDIVTDAYFEKTGSRILVDWLAADSSRRLR